MLRLRVTALLGLALLTALSTRLVAQGAHYHVVKRLVLGHERADYIIVDPIGRRLYGMGDKVIDVDRDTVIGAVEGGGGGYAIAADQNRGLVRDGVVFNLKTLAVEGHVDTKGDGIRYDSFTHRAFTWEGKNTWVVDMRTGKLIGTPDIGEGYESAVADGKGKLFFNVEDSGFVQVVSAVTYARGATFKVPHCGRAQGLAGDLGTHRLFMACDTEMVVLNWDNGGIVQRVRVPSRADENAFDPGTKLAFNANRVDSTMTIVHEDSPDRFSVVATVPTGGGARTCAVDEKTHKVYLFYYDGANRQTAQLVMAVMAP